MVSIITVSFNTVAVLRQCLQSVEDASQYLAVEMIVVDNASWDGSSAMVEQEFPWVKLIRNSQNVGFAKACNQGIPVATGNYVLLLNSDVQVQPGTLPRMVELLQQQSTVGAAACLLRNEDGSVQASVRDFPSLKSELFGAFFLDRLFPDSRLFGAYLKKNLNFQVNTQVDQVSGAFLMVRRSVLQDVGLLDERFFIYYEDVDWCLRIKQAGWEILYVPDCWALHYGGNSANQFNAFSYVEGVRSKILYFRKHFGGATTLLVQVLVMVEMSMRLLIWLGGKIMTLLRSRKSEPKQWDPAVALRICRVAWLPRHTSLSTTEPANA